MPGRRRRIWSELVPLDELRRSPLLEELARRDVQLLVAVQPGQAEAAVALLERARAVGLCIGLWPLLDDARGRWLNPSNAEPFEAWVVELLEAVDAAGRTVDALALDLEPPIAEVRRVSDGRWDAARAWLRRELDEAPHRRLVALGRRRGLEVIAAVIPAVVAPGRAGEGWQRALGAPLSVGYDAVTTMLYTTLFEGYSQGVVRREDACALLARFAGQTRARLGGRASVSLGAVGVGALGDEQPYREPGELAQDVAVARAAGVDDLALFDLAGVLARPPAERWLDALTETAPARTLPAPTARSRAVTVGLWLTGVTFHAATRLAGG
ncbi:MAG TPA: hypothetical protein RMH99_06560 [Sandaracinaceae bacterium LLY-WYZ-13_1]|nr:hypothetical protein [Sandaracinaceae bacterium LLY-WYZ-13_1]